MNKIILATVDAGRSNTKGVAEGFRDSIPAHVKPWRKLNLARRMNRNDLEVEYEGEHWWIGDIARDESGGEGSQRMTASKVHYDTKLLTLTMLHRLVPDGASVFLTTGAPIETDEAEKIRIKQLLYGDHEIKVNGDTKHIHIARIEVGVECATAAWMMRRPGTYTVVDPGSRTVNFATIKNGRWWDEKSGTLDYGTESVQVSKSQFARMMMADLSKRMRQFHPIILIGGNAEAYYDDIQRQDPQLQIEVYEDAFYANAQAFYDLGRVALEKARA